MITYGLKLSAVIVIACVNQYLLTHADARCSDCLEALFGLNDRGNDTAVSEDALDHEYEPLIDERSLSEAFEVIDKHLMRTIDTDDFDTNMAEVRALIRNEMVAKSLAQSEERKNWLTRWSDRRRCLSQQLPSKSSKVMVNALMRLVGLSAGQTLHACGFSATTDLSRCNRIARDPIGARTKLNAVLKSRIDHLVFDAAVRRANLCLPHYQGELRPLARTSDPSVELVRGYWNLILEHRFKAARFGAKHESVEQIFKRDPEGAMNRVLKMRTAIRDDEADIARRFLGAAHQREQFTGRTGRERTTQFEAYLKNPCSYFVGLAQPTMSSLNFDLQVRQYVGPELMQDFSRDGETQRVRAYYWLCSKLRDQTEIVLRQIAPDEQ